MADYAPTVNPVALLSSPFMTPDGTVNHGSDPPPAITPGAFNFLKTSLDVITNPTGEKKTDTVEQNKASVLGSLGKILNDFFSKDFLWSVVLVVIGLMLLSRGFGLLGEEGESVIVNLANPDKFPGVGHAIQGLRRKKS
jgi:hypothetical protein